MLQNQWRLTLDGTAMGCCEMSVGTGEEAADTATYEFGVLAICVVC